MDSDKARERTRRRADPAEARAAFERLAPERDARRQLLAHFASAIELAHSVSPSGWEVTLKTGSGSVRLNVGILYVLKAGEGGIRISIDDQALEASERDDILRQAEDLGPFKVVRGRLLKCSLDTALRLWPRIEGAHRQLVRAAAGAQKWTPFQFAHSPGVVDYLSEELGRPLPRPAYASSGGGGGSPLSAEKRAEVARLFGECASQYFATPAGEKHLAGYAVGREEARLSFRELKAAGARGEDVTDRVLLRILPHADTAGNRERGAWIHLAPAITKDARMFFEGAGWAKPSDWPVIARAVLRLVERAEADPDALSEAVAEFEESCPARGFQAGMLSPFLNALKPEAFPILNGKSRRLVNYLSGQNFGHSLREYPAVRAVALALIEELEDVLVWPAAPGLLPGDAFDVFSHWLYAVKDFDYGSRRYWKIAPGEKASAWTAWREGGFAGLGWSELGDLSGLARTDFVRRRDEILATRPDWTQAGLNQVWDFSRIEPGDRVLANKGTNEVLGLGTVTEPYSFVEGQEHPHRLGVRWDDVGIRSVNQPGWRRTLVKLDKEQFDAIEKLPSKADVKGGASEYLAGAFEWLGKLAAQPTREYYLAHKEKIAAAVEAPVQELLRRVVSLLPEPIADRLETEKNVFGRLLKNDWGRGGVWDFYWGALYPKGGRRVEDAQLFVSVKPDVLTYGFSVGQYGGLQSARLLENLRRHERLVEHVLEAARLESVTYGRLPAKAAEGGSGTIDCRAWLADPAKFGLDVQIALAPAAVKGRGLDRLAEEIAAAFKGLFPLVLLASLDDPIPEVRKYLEGGKGGGGTAQPAYALEALAADSGLSRDTLTGWLAAIQRKRQAVIFGPPGTGKTFVARLLARHLVSERSGFAEVLQFHPAYSYEDFIQGIRPVATGSQLSYELVKGRFLEVCERADECAPDPCVLILDEINRANLSRVFGELMYLLEYREETIPLAGSRKLRVPENLLVIGTMNTADRSIALVDHALRRRFAFLRLQPQYDALVRFHTDRETGVAGDKLAELLRKVNQAINDPHYEVGTSFFLREDLAEDFADVWKMEIEPYLEEYFFDKPQRVEEFRWDKVKPHLGVDE